jgi:phage shock protein PspC (stress-responsive transcriptional regulator)
MTLIGFLTYLATAALHVAAVAVPAAIICWLILPEEWR